jgi:hypothetical protein
MANEAREERELRSIVGLLRARGITVRREKLTRGVAFRVKSGSCEVFGDDVLYVDKNLSPKQQISIMIDYLLDHQVELSREELELLSASNRALFAAAEQSGEAGGEKRSA